MSLFWDNANKLLEAAISAAQAGFSTSESMTVLIGAEGGIHLLANNDWPLDRLADDRGAPMAYRVTQGNGRIAVEGLNGPTSCHIETEQPNSRIKALLRDEPRYQIESL